MDNGKYVCRKFSKKFKKVLDKPKDMWYNIKVVAQKAITVTEKLQKFFWKNSKKDLTSLKKCDIINKSLDEDWAIQHLENWTMQEK